MGLKWWPLIWWVSDAAAFTVIVKQVLALTDLLLCLLEHLYAPLYMLISSSTAHRPIWFVSEWAAWLWASDRLAIEVQSLVNHTCVPVDVCVSELDTEEASLWIAFESMATLRWAVGWPKWLSTAIVIHHAPPNSLHLSSSSVFQPQWSDPIVAIVPNSAHQPLKLLILLVLANGLMPFRLGFILPVKLIH